MENTENTENTKLTDVEIVEKLVREYVQENEVSPFVDIQMEEEGKMNVDMDSGFEKNVKEQTSNLEQALSDYFSNFFREFMEKIDEGLIDEDELKELVESAENPSN